MRKWLAAPLLAVGLWFVGGSLPALAGSPGVQGGDEESLRSILGRNVCLVDNNGLTWNLSIAGGSITGTMDGNICDPHRNVTGSHVGRRFTLVAPDNGGRFCCDFQYVGVADVRSRTARGIWMNLPPPDNCTASGTFIMGLC